MEYNFNEIIRRIGTDSVKWDTIPGNPDAIAMWVADMDFRCPKPVIDKVMEKAAFGIYAYNIVPPSFRASTAGWQLRRHGWDIGDAQVIPMSSVVPALYTAVAAFTEPGDKVILQRPVYGPFTACIESQGRQVSNNALRLEKGRYEIDFEDLEERAKDPGTKLMLLCSPHNPVGRVFTRQEVERIGRICEENNVILFADEIHADFVYPGAVHTPAGMVCEKCMVAVAPSKTFNLASMKCASVITQDKELAEKFKKVLALSHADNLNMLGMYAYIAAYEQGDEYIDQLLVHLQGNIAYLAAYLKEHLPKIHLIQPEGTYLMWLDCRELGKTQQELTQFFTWDAGVAMNEGNWFGPEGEGFVRMNLACPRPTLEEALRRIRKAYETLL